MGENASELQIELMRNEAQQRIDDSAVLSGCVRSDSAYLLDLLAFEILLKALIRIHGKQPYNSHQYVSLFKMLPSDVQDRIKSTAEWARSDGDYTNLDRALENFRNNFIGLRYPYEKYEELNRDEYLALGDRWLSEGAKLEQADYRYYPAELCGLIQGLITEVDAWINSRDPELSPIEHTTNNCQLGC